MSINPITSTCHIKNIFQKFIKFFKVILLCTEGRSTVNSPVVGNSLIVLIFGYVIDFEVPINKNKFSTSEPSACIIIFKKIMQIIVCRNFSVLVDNRTNRYNKFYKRIFFLKLLYQIFLVQLIGH